MRALVRRPPAEHNGRCACSWSRMRRSSPTCLPAGCARRAMSPRWPAAARTPLWMARAALVRRDRARRHAPGPGRLCDLPRPARRRRLVAGSVPDRARRGREPDRGARQRRRRLPREAVLVRGAAGPAARARSPALPPSARSCSRSAISGSIPRSHRAWRGEVELELSPKEFALLESFMRRPGQALSRLQLLESAWDIGYESRSNLVDVYVRYLRAEDRPAVRPARDRDGAARRLPAARGRRIGAACRSVCG